MSFIYDLHCHSNHSDGVLTPEALVSRAKEKNVAYLALTDHDTVSGVARARAESERIGGPTIVAGIEFSSLWRNKGVHIVGLNIDLQSSVLCEAIKNQENMRLQRAHAIAEKLEKAGVEDAFEGANRHADGGVIGRPHFAKYLLEAGYVNTMNGAFKKYLGAGKPGDVKHFWPEMEEVVSWIEASGGQAVIAHPMKYKISRTKLCAMIEDFLEVGGTGIEVISGRQDPNITKDLVKIAQKFSLLGSCGSDFHVPNAGWQELGVGGLLPQEMEPIWSSWSAA